MDMKLFEKKGSPAANVPPANKAKSHDTPEFHGLIERRHLYDKGMPLPNFAHAQTVKPRSEAFGQPKATVKHEPKPKTADAGETTSFLMSLDNSAIQLADTGLFRLPKGPGFESSQD
jgi:hypothetical protein